MVLWVVLTKNINPTSYPAPPPPHYKLTLRRGLYVSSYLLQVLNLSWAQTRPVASSSLVLLLLFFNLVQQPINNVSAKH